MSAPNPDEIEQMLLGGEMPPVPKRRSSSRGGFSLSDLITFWMFVEKIRERERQEIITALKQQQQEEKMRMTKMYETIEKLLNKVDKVTDMFIEFYLPFKIRMSRPMPTAPGAAPPQPQPQKKVEIDVEI